MSTDRRMDKQTVIYPYNAITIPEIKRHKLLTYTTTWMNLQIIIQGRRDKRDEGELSLLNLMFKEEHEKVVKYASHCAM